MRNWIREIRIENFRGIENLSLSFLDPSGEPSHVVVIAGPNGCGKTTVLEACLLLAGQHGLLKGSREARQGATSFRITGSALISRTVREAEVDRHSSHGLALSCRYFSSWRAPVLPGALEITAGKKGKRPNPTEANQLWILKQALINAKAYQSMSPQGSTDRSYTQAIEQIQKLWRLFYPHANQTFSVEPAGQSPDAGFDVFLNEGDVRIPLDALSSGQLELFLLAGSALPGQPAPALLCIDEPELHLDPQWHRLIVRALQMLYPETQLILGTHSPEIYDAVLSHQRHFLVPPDDPRATFWSRGGGR